jgi:macrolide transport system ATP-binding/permease protein
VIQDFRFALRQLLQSKGFTATAILTLALGIGANSAIFTLVHTVMLKSLPVLDPAQLYRLGDTEDCCVVGGYRARTSIFAYPFYLNLRDNTPEFAELAAFQASVGGVGVRRGSGPSLPYDDKYVSGNYFTMLGIKPYAGRLLSPSDDRAGAAPVAVISYRAWVAFGSDPSLVGSTLTIEGTPMTITGIAPPGFFGETVAPAPPDFWIPLADEPIIEGHNSLLKVKDNYWLYIIGRIKPGASVAEIESRVNGELRQWFLVNVPPHDAEGRKALDRQHITVAPAGGGVAMLKDYYENDLKLLLTITGLVLLIACANLANLQLARGMTRMTQISIRAALGAGRWALLRQALVESALLAVMGGIVGLLVAMELAEFLVRLAFPHIKYIPIETSPSIPVLGFTFALSLITGVAFGIAPAWSAARIDPANALRASGRGAAGHSTLAQRSLVALQAAISLALLTGAGMMAKTLGNLQNQWFGYNPNGRVIAHVGASFSTYTPAKIGVIYSDLRRNLKQLPGVVNASLSLYSPMTGNNWQSGVKVEEHPDLRVQPSWDRISAEFFDTIGARIVRGRGFDERDQPNSTHVAVVNEAFVKKVFPDEDPIGKRFGFATATDYQIAGVVENIRLRDLRKPTDPMFFVPLLQVTDKEWAAQGMGRSNLIGDIELHVSSGAEGLAGELQKLFAQTDPNLTLLRLNTFDQLVEGRMAHTTLIARLIELLGAIAALLACIGLYGITAYAVARRTGEIGIRAALGATRGRVARMILGGALAQTGVGLAVGIPCAYAVGKVLEAQFYGVENGNPIVMTSAAMALIAAAVVASLLPAWRASSIDPATALRTE